MNKNFTNSALFRIFGPPIYGIVVYVLILLIFDSISQLYENFFSAEVFLCIVIAYLLSELMRLLIKFIEKLCPKNCTISFRILVQFSVMSVFSIMVTSIIISAYYKYLVGFTNFTTELIVFNSIYLLSTVFYNLLYFSIYYLNKLNEMKLQHENQIRKNLENELTSYKNKINPDFLFDSFETILSLAYKKSEEADQFVNKLSSVYRHILSNKKNELIQIDKELSTANDFVTLLNYKYENSIRITQDLVNNVINKDIVPGTLLICIENIVKRTIVSSIQPLEIKIFTENGSLIVEHKKINKVSAIENTKLDIENLNRAYNFFKNKKIEINAQNGLISYVIPIIEVTD